MTVGKGRAIAVTGGVAVLAAAVSATAIGVGGRSGTAVAERTPPATATVERTTLTETKQVDGTLGYGDTAAVTGRGQGTITWLPDPGATITRGRAVYSADADRVPLLYGTLPLYRVLTTGVEGRDVRQLEQNLARLGYDGFTVDDTFTSATRAAVEAWQDDLGLPETGRVAPGDVVVHDGPLRVAEVKAALGGQAAGPVLTITGTTREVTVALDVADRHMVKKGTKASVELPDGTTVQGTVASVGKVATQATDAQGETETTVEVIVSVRDDAKLRSYDTAPVDVTIVSAKRENVLAVPVAALLALSEGGYGVQVEEGPATRYVAVETGMFADGKVEVTGVDEGATVVVPK
ncbi:peptidoglycan-binding protein [Planotetraspora thailandica]|uniref:Peptidoglycan-binding protein n=1 Tax=Planotetraspora thailandica TaxID=487172 RepID=A0A8J3V5N8_9ACTN|nr:peptidoglycan-binding protein [Planotetraspora thailandica]GII57158.1 peptidoglycan-binding protein [Planotetraspora thailandica]